MEMLDMKRGDVTGDGVPDAVYLYGNKPNGATSPFADQITLVIQDGYTGRVSSFPLPSGAGYNARLFLGDFNRDRIDDILISIDTGGSGGYGIFYVFTYRNAVLRQLFDYNAYNADYQFRVNYENFYRVSVSSPSLDVLFTLDISSKGDAYLSQFYDANGQLKKPVQGEVLAIGALYPIVTDERSGSYDLLASQRIIGTTNADTLGHVENLLTWNGSQFVSSRLAVSITGTKLATLY